ncbi:hypothetical protein [Extensimonas vulgaris]|uniref:Uncharacterized protein n=1 Tax=Extensimonas vulgaris TaxID=1031594 RepID=A0A369AMT5_9BURK|nr:hypothetical protein [Extensimonas vulgaris]RCX10702.1 hypothetical protein DFR45_102103 [Extensimonas vulgaris]TWI41344.1 hypothetical protein IP95_00101 [Extensimonas vulgaris]TXD16813.1 hypothetical protein FUT63_02140 [Extensimonas vulgaris]
MATRHAKVAPPYAMQDAQAASDALGKFVAVHSHVLHDGVLYAPGQTITIDAKAAQRLGLTPAACDATETQIAQE